MEQQRESAKQELAETTVKYEQVLIQLQKKTSFDKERTESEQSQARTAADKQLKSQSERIDDLNARLNLKSKELQQAEDASRDALSRLRAVEKELGAVKKQADKNTTEASQRELNVQSQQDNLIRNYEARLQEMAAQMAKDKEVFRQKLVETESRNKEVEARRSSMVFELEKERTQWSIEAEKLRARNEEIQDLLQRVKHKSTTLQRENDKLKQTKPKPFAGSMTQRTLSSQSGALSARGERTSSLIKLNFKPVTTEASKENDHVELAVQPATSRNSTLMLSATDKSRNDK